MEAPHKEQDQETIQTGTLVLAETSSATDHNFTGSLKSSSDAASGDGHSGDPELALEVQEQLLRVEIHAAALLFLFGAGLAANGLVLLLFHRKPSLRSFSNRFVVHLASIHLLQALLVTPYAVGTAFSRRWVFGHVWCQISGVASLALNVAAVLSLLLIAVDRNCAVNSPLHYSMTITKRRTSWLISSVWLLSGLSALPPLFGVSRIEYRPAWGLCAVFWQPGDLCAIIYSTYLCLVGFALPFIKMIWIYCSMFRAAQRSSARARQHSVNSASVDSSELAPAQPTTSQPTTSSPPHENGVVPALGRRRLGHSPVTRRRSSCSQSFVMGEEWKAARTGLIILLSFFLCWFPFFAAALIEPWLSPGWTMPGFVPATATLLALSASVLDPYIYVFRNRAVRKQLRKLFWCFKNSKNNRLHQQRVPYTSEFVGCSMTASFRERNHLWRNARSTMQVVPNLLSDIAENPNSPSPPSSSLSHPLATPHLQTVDVQASSVCGVGSSLVMRTITNPCAGLGGESSFDEEVISVRSTDGLILLKLRRRAHRRGSSTMSDSTLNWGSSCDSGEAPDEEEVSRATLPRELVRVHTIKAASWNARPIIRRSRTVEEQDLTIVVGGQSQSRGSGIRMHSEESSEATYTSADSQDLGQTSCIVVRSTKVRPKLVRQCQTREEQDSDDEDLCYVIKKTSL